MSFRNHHINRRGDGSSSSSEPQNRSPAITSFGVGTHARVVTHFTAPRQQVRLTRDGYHIDDFVAASEDDSDPETTRRALRTLRRREEARRARRLEDAIEYARLAEQQRARRILRGMPAEEEDCGEEDIEDAENDDDDDEGDEEEYVQHVPVGHRRRRTSRSREQLPAQRRRVYIVVSD